MFMLKKLLVEKEHVELLCMLNWSMLNYMRDEIMYVEKIACWFQCILKYLHFEKFVGRTPTFQPLSLTKTQEIGHLFYRAGPVRFQSAPSHK